MRVLLRNRKTGLFLLSKEEWTAERNLAKNFITSLAVMHHVKATGIPDAEAVLDFGKPELDLAIPVDAPVIRPPISESGLRPAP